MKYSFIIPTYNRAYILKKAIDSILNQNGEHDFEILICDDGSKDTTKQLVESLNDQRIKYLYQENQGPSVARNMGLTVADGEWIAYLDSDNELMPEYLNIVEKYLSENPKALYIIPRQKRIVEVYNGDRLIETKDLTETSQANTSMLDYYQRRNNSDTNGFLHSKIFIELGSKWDKNLMGPEDWDFFMQLADLRPDGFLFIPETIALYVRRLGKGSDGIISNKKFKQWQKDCKYIYEKHKNSTLMRGQNWYPPKEEDFGKY